MTAWTVVLTAEARRDVLRLDPALQTRLLNRIEWLGTNIELVRHQALQGEEWGSCFKYRVGDYRIIYQMAADNKQLIVLKVGHRREVYG